jgi:hypothetical protein
MKKALNFIVYVLMSPFLIITAIGMIGVVILSYLESEEATKHKK